jgi:hypothetical protein
MAMVRVLDENAEIGDRKSQEVRLGMGSLAWFKPVFVLITAARHRLGWITLSEDNLGQWRWNWSTLVIALTTNDASNGDPRINIG